MTKACPHFIPSSSRLFYKSSESFGPNSRPIVRNGTYKRKSDSKWVDRFYCRICKLYFSRATFSENYLQKKRRLNPIIHQLMVSGVSQRRCAIILGVNRKTVVRKFRHLSKVSESIHEKWLKKMSCMSKFQEIQFDDMETSEHSKLKPLSIAIAVEAKTRKIIDFQVSRMPARGPLSSPSIKKYGYRKDERGLGWSQIMKRLSSVVHSDALITSDKNPHYSRYIKKAFPNCNHVTVKGRDACVVGQGELKKVGFDPIFSLNHTCAMVRANLNRMFRRTWCTTKTVQGLIDHLWLYVRYHNMVLTDDELPQTEGPVRGWPSKPLPPT